MASIRSRQISRSGFDYASGTSPELKRTIDVLLSNKRPFDAATKRQLAELANRAGNSGAADVSGRLLDVIDTVQRLMQSAVEGNQDQIAALQTVQNNAEKTNPPELLHALMRELAVAAERAAVLETSLAETHVELEASRASYQLVEQRSKTDPLTGLANRRGLDDYLKERFIVSMESGEPLSILMMDIDHFKSFNDRFGHGVGDQVIKLIASTIKSKVRPDDFAARYGGEELMAILPCTELGLASEVAERVRSSISECRITRRSTGEVLPSVSISIGVAQFRLGDAVADLFERADQALYQAKRSGRNKVVTETEFSTDLLTVKEAS